MFTRFDQKRRVSFVIKSVDMYFASMNLSYTTW